ncbi:MAG TPA: PAS domain S-box protein [Myxococcota bacterium]|nr:PAS domain S-box protein [Myxococcota bacterium]
MADPGDARIAATVHILSLSFAAAIIGFGVASLLLLRRPALVPIPVSLGLVLVAAYWLAHRGSPRLAARVLVVGTWLGTTWAVAMTGSVNSPALGAYLIVVLATGLLIGSDAAISAAVLSGLAVLAIAALETRGMLPERVVQTPWSVVATALTLFVAAAGLLSDALGRLSAAVTRAERSEARTRALIDQASDAIIVLDAEGHVLEASARAGEMSGYAREELARTWVPALLGVDNEAEPPLGALQPGQVWVRERSLRRKDGSELPVESSIGRLSDGRIQCIVRDVGARKRAEAMQERLRLALDEAGEGIALLDAEGRLLYANRAFRRLCSGDGAQREGARIDEVAAPELQAVWQRAQPELAQAPGFASRFERRLPADSRAVHHVTWTRVEGLAGERAGLVAIVRDVTREMELEESVQLTRKLDAVSQLARGLVHDFNNLLTVILGSAEAIRARYPSEDVDEILEAGQRAAALTTKLASFTRNQAVRLARVDLNRVVRDVEGMLSRLVRENVSLELGLASHALWVDADPNQLHQVLVNLATNARDAMPEGGTLEISTASVDLSRATRPARVLLPDGPYALLSVQDSGAGMSEEVIERVFEPFFTTKEPGRGTGLGLASVYEIVKQMKGAIDVQSQLGKGTRLRIYLPRASAPESLRGLPRAVESAQASVARILVVDDEALLRGLVARSLESRGHQVVAARSAREALELARSEPPDLLVTDVVLPDLDGSQLTAQLRERWPQLRALLMSGYEPERVADAIGEDDRTLFLPKPFTLAQLAAGVEQLLAKR